jgi:hypothetical protein
LIVDLNKQLDVAQKVLDGEGKFSGLIPVDTTPAVPEDLTNQIDEYFRRPANTAKPADKTVADRNAL